MGGHTGRAVSVTFSNCATCVKTHGARSVPNLSVSNCRGSVASGCFGPPVHVDIGGWTRCVHGNNFVNPEALCPSCPPNVSRCN